MKVLWAGCLTQQLRCAWNTCPLAQVPGLLSQLQPAVQRSINVDLGRQALESLSLVEFCAPGICFAVIWAVNQQTGDHCLSALPMDKIPATEVRETEAQHIQFSWAQNLAEGIAHGCREGGCSHPGRAMFLPTTVPGVHGPSAAGSPVSTDPAQHGP